jgi:predicted nucleotidyltransferase
MPLLRALSARATPATAPQLERVAGIGTAAGIRRALDRLAEHGVCLREDVGGRLVYSLNHNHVLHDAVVALLDSEQELVRRLRSTVRRWHVPARAAVLFGSAARKDGDLESDIDLLLVRPALTLAGEKRDWAMQVHELRTQVHGWTGNRLQVVDWTIRELHRSAARSEPLIDGLLSDGVKIAGTTLRQLLSGDE